MLGTLDAVHALAGVSQLLPKCRENYLNRCMDQERLRRESTSQKEIDKVGLSAGVTHAGRTTRCPPVLAPPLSVPPRQKPKPRRQRRA